MKVFNNPFLLRVLNSYVLDPSHSSNIKYIQKFNSLMLLCLIIQIVTGVTLGMHYTPNVLEAFDSVEHIMRDVNNQLLIRYLHSNTASAYFFLVYLHIVRGLYYRLSIASRILITGILAFILMMTTVFFGYILPREHYKILCFCLYEYLGILYSKLYLWWLTFYNWIWFASRESISYLPYVYSLVMFIYRCDISPDEFLNNYTLLMESSSHNPGNQDSGGSGSGFGQSSDPNNQNKPDPSNKGKEKESTSLGKRKATDDEESQNSSSSKRKGKRPLYRFVPAPSETEASVDNRNPNTHSGHHSDINVPSIAPSIAEQAIGKFQHSSYFSQKYMTDEEIKDCNGPRGGRQILGNEPSESSKAFWNKYRYVRPLPQEVENTNLRYNRGVIIPELRNSPITREYLNANPREGRWLPYKVDSPAFDAKKMAELNQTKSLSLQSSIVKELLPNGTFETLVEEKSIADNGSQVTYRYPPLKSHSICHCCENGDGVCSHRLPNTVQPRWKEIDTVPVRAPGPMSIPCKDWLITAGATSREYHCCKCNVHLYSYVCGGCGCTFCKNCHKN